MAFCPKCKSAFCKGDFECVDRVVEKQSVDVPLWLARRSCPKYPPTCPHCKTKGDQTERGCLKCMFLPLNPPKFIEGLAPRACVECCVSYLRAQTLCKNCQAILCPDDQIRLGKELPPWKLCQGCFDQLCPNDRQRWSDQGLVRCPLCIDHLVE